MIDSENYNCSICNQQHQVFYTTMIVGGYPDDRMIEEKVADDLYIGIDHIYIHGLVHISVVDRNKYCSYKIWVEFSRIEWDDHYSNRNDNQLIRLPGRFIEVIPLYPNLPVAEIIIGYDEDRGNYQFTLGDNDDFGRHQIYGITFKELCERMSTFYHEVIEIDAVDKNENIYDDLQPAIEKMLTDIDNQFVHAIYQSVVIFQIINISFTNLPGADHQISSLCIDIPIDISAGKDFIGMELEYLINRGYKQEYEDGIKIYQLEVGLSLKDVMQEVRQLAVSVFDAPESELKYEVNQVKRLKN